MINSGASLGKDSEADEPAMPTPRRVVTIVSACSDSLTNKVSETLRKVLDESELSRLASLKNEDLRCQYLVAHALLRTALSVQFSALPSEWRFRRSSSGAPVIEKPIEARGLNFTLSHTQSLVVCAISETCRVGVDAEKIKTDFDLAQLIPHVFSEDEMDEFVQEELETRADRFYHLWTLKEALLKAIGQGLRIKPTSVSFSSPMSLTPELVHLPPELGHRGEWSFRTLGISEMHACALAVRIPPKEPFHIHFKKTAVDKLVKDVQNNEPVTSCCASTFICSGERGIE